MKKLESRRRIYKGKAIRLPLVSVRESPRGGKCKGVKLLPGHKYNARVGGVAFEFFNAGPRPVFIRLGASRE